MKGPPFGGGGSGGGPHALAVAALLGNRVSRAACLVGVAPYTALGADFFTGMDPQNVKEFGWALEGEERLAAEYIGEPGAGNFPVIGVEGLLALGWTRSPQRHPPVLWRRQVGGHARRHERLV
jgi:hypothetical protein